MNLKVCGRVNLLLLLRLKVLLDNFCLKKTCFKSGTQWDNQWLELLFRRLSSLAWNQCKMAQDRSTKHCVRAIQHQICTYQDERETSAIRAEQLHHSHNGFKVYSEFVFIKFILSEKATKFCEIFTILTTVKSKVKILQNFVAFPEYMNFNFKTLSI